MRQRAAPSLLKPQNRVGPVALCKLGALGECLGSQPGLWGKNGSPRDLRVFLGLSLTSVSLTLISTLPCTSRRKSPRDPPPQPSLRLVTGVRIRTRLPDGRESLAAGRSGEEGRRRGAGSSLQSHPGPLPSPLNCKSQSSVISLEEFPRD